MKVILLLAGLVAADINLDDPMLHPQMKREILQARQTLPDLSPSCTSAVLGLYSSLPTPPARLVSALGSGNPCSASVPSSLNSEFSDYQSSIGSWYSSNSGDVSSAFSVCPELSSLVSLLPVCVTSFLGGAAAGGSSGTDTASGASSTDTASGASSTGTASGASSTNTASGASNTDTASSSGGSANSQTTDTGSSSATGASATGSDTGAAPRETGFAMAALAAAGAIAAVL